MVRKRIIFYGRVQGVGFRYQARYIAKSLKLTGWVRNEYDGSVTMEVQGDESAVNGMLRQLQEDSYIHIQDVEVTDLPVEAGERKFGVRHY